MYARKNNLIYVTRIEFRFVEEEEEDEEEEDEEDIDGRDCFPTTVDEGSV
ncbi:unnamed protein product, partial [Rotaria magnacalcarata]